MKDKFLHILSLLILFFDASFTLSIKAETPDTLMVNGHCGFVDTETHRVLFTLSDKMEMPQSITREGIEYTVETTTLPLVEVLQGEVFSDRFSAGNIEILSPEGAYASYASNLRYRGATALGYTKKNYALKLVDNDGNDLNASFFGMRSDNSWILDAMAADVARMRNRVSTDIWLDFSRRPYYAATQEPDMVNGTHGQFVEVFVNHHYWGLYCLTEKVDRKQLKVKKFKEDTQTVRGIIYKSINYDNMRAITETADNDSSIWQGWESAYPDTRKDEPFNWTPLYDLTDFLSRPAEDATVADNLASRVDMPVWIDYNIFCDLMHGDDNAAKNIILYYRDITSDETKACVCPWDMDATWGRDWKQNQLAPESNCNVANGVNYHIQMTYSTGFALMIFRWANLRDDIFQTEQLWPYFERYFDLFRSSGAAERETERWQDADGVHLDFDAEESYIHDWIDKRLNYLDADYYYTPKGIQSIESAETEKAIYTLSGQRIGSCRDINELQQKNLPSGIYVIGGRKVFVR